MSEEENHRDKLAELRTLLALERNNLAEERTIFAKFRTGLTLALISPSLYLYSIALNWKLGFIFLIIFYIFLITCGTVGTYEALQSRIKLKINRKLKCSIVEKEKEILNSSKRIYDLFSNVMIIDENQEKNLKFLRNLRK